MWGNSIEKEEAEEIVQHVLSSVPILKFKLWLGIFVTISSCCLFIYLLAAMERATIFLTTNDFDDDNDNDDDNNDHRIGHDTELEIEHSRSSGDDNDETNTNNNNNNAYSRTLDDDDNVKDNDNNNDVDGLKNNNNNNNSRNNNNSSTSSSTVSIVNNNVSHNSKKKKVYRRLLPSQLFIIVLQVGILTLLNYLLLVFLPGGGIISCIGMLCCWLVTLKHVVADEIRRNRYDRITYMIALFLSVAAGLSLCTYSSLAIQEGYIYTGPAYIVGYDTTSYNNNDGETIRTDLQVSWGWNWGCPNTYDYDGSMKTCNRIDVSGALCETKYDSSDNSSEDNPYMATSSYTYDYSYNEQLHDEEGDDVTTFQEAPVVDGNNEYEEVVYQDKTEKVIVDENASTGEIDDVDVVYANGTESVQVTDQNSTVGVTTYNTNSKSNSNNNKYQKTNTNNTSSSTNTNNTNATTGQVVEEEQIKYNRNGTQQITTSTTTTQTQQNSTTNNTNGGGRMRKMMMNRDLTRRRRNEDVNNQEGGDDGEEEEVEMDEEIVETVVEEDEVEFEDEVYDAAYDEAVDAVNSYDQDEADSDVTIEELEQENEDLEKQNEELEQENEQLQQQINKAEQQNEDLITEETDLIEDEEIETQENAADNLYSYDDTIYNDDYWNYYGDDGYGDSISWNDVWGEYACEDLFSEDLSSTSHPLRVELSPGSNYNTDWPTIEIYGNCNTCTAYLVDYYSTEHFQNISQYQKQARRYMSCSVLTAILALVLYFKQRYYTPKSDSKMELLTTSTDGGVMA